MMGGRGWTGYAAGIFPYLQYALVGWVELAGKLHKVGHVSRDI